MNMFPIIFGALTFVSTLAGGVFAVRFRKRFEILAAFAAGVLIAVSLFDLLPEAFRLATTARVPLEQVMYVTAGGFIFLLILERYFSVHKVYAFLTGHAPMFITIREGFSGLRSSRLTASWTDWQSE